MVSRDCSRSRRSRTAVASPSQSLGSTHRLTRESARAGIRPIRASATPGCLARLTIVGTPCRESRRRVAASARPSRRPAVPSSLSLPVIDDEIEGGQDRRSGRGRRGRLLAAMSPSGVRSSSTASGPRPRDTRSSHSSTGDPSRAARDAHPERIGEATRDVEGRRLVCRIDEHADEGRAIDADVDPLLTGEPAHVLANEIDTENVIPGNVRRNHVDDHQLTRPRSDADRNGRSQTVARGKGPIGRVPPIRDEDVRRP